VQVADRWQVNFCDLSGSQGMLGQVQGRTADDAAYWLLQAPPPGVAAGGWGRDLRWAQI
jgi:hypothetical protein